MRSLLFVCLVLLAACQTLPPLPAWQASGGRQGVEPGTIRDLRSGASLTPAQLVERLAAAPRLLVGEKHDNPDHHALELWLLEALAGRRAQGSLLLEMLEPDQQARVAATQAAFAAGQVPANLPVALAWRQGWDWALYGPLLRHALAQPYPLLAANLDRQEVRRVYAERPALSGAASSSARVREVLLAQIGASHCGQLPESQWPAMLAVQQQRDRRMAERLLAAPQPPLLLAGAYHVRRDLGVPLHLADLGGAAGSVVLLLAEAGEALGAEAADYVWYTPATPARDYCAEMRAADAQAKKDPAEPGRKP
ncbi:ChaN family lipoprotein [Azotobacter beijerinckii]|uniref:ChaN family lipoprotein n=1 Tax=Azotobacter beijerinckii TaxID=170623 RepID=UPI000AF17353|nr:ChaN family lipoprotein [Azotobacter beijerinckii]